MAGAAIASSRVTLPPAARVAMPSPMLPEALAANPLAELFSVCQLGPALNLVEPYIAGAGQAELGPFFDRQIERAEPVANMQILLLVI